MNKRHYILDLGPFMQRVSIASINLPEPDINRTWQHYWERTLFTFGGMNVEGTVAAGHLCPSQWRLLSVIDEQVGALIRRGLLYNRYIVNRESGRQCRLVLEKTTAILIFE